MSAKAVPLPSRRELPESVAIIIGAPPRHSPYETRLLREMTGRSYFELAGGDAPAEDQERVMVWLALRRLGYEPTWEEAEHVLLDFQTPDPTKGGSSTSSPPSVDIGP